MDRYCAIKMNKEQGYRPGRTVQFISNRTVVNKSCYKRRLQRALVVIGCRVQPCDMFAQANSQSNLRTNKAPTPWDPDTVIKQILVKLL